MQKTTDHAGTPATMNAARLGAFFRDAGERVFTSHGIEWIESGPRFLLSLPTHTGIDLTAEQERAVLQETGALGLRYIANRGGQESFQIVASDSEFSLDKLSGNTRSKIRRGLKRNEIRRISGSELAEVGERAFLDTVERQRRGSDKALQSWRRLMKAADRESAVEIWSAWHEGEFASYLLVMMIDDVCEFYQARSRNDLLRHYPNNALIYTLTEEMLVKRGLREITFGIESLEDVAELDRFKWSMGFEKKPMRQKAVFGPLLGNVLKPKFARRTLASLAARPDAHVALRKAQGLVRLAGMDPNGA